MATEFITGEGVVFCVWGKPAKSDIDQLFQHLQKASRRIPESVVYITRVPVDSPPPAGEVRAYLDSLMPIMTPWFSSVHVVLEGTGFVAAMKRGVLLSLFQIGGRRNTFFVHATTDDVLRKVNAAKQSTVRLALQRAKGRGLLSCPPPKKMVA